MNLRFTVVETTLNRAEFRWKWLRFLRHTFLLGIILCLLVLLFGGAIAFGWITSKALATTFFALLAVLGLIAWAVIVIGVAAGATDRSWLAAALERVDRRLLDRLNTLLFLEQHRRDAGAQSFALRIAKQTRGVLAKKTPPPPFPATPVLAHLLIFAGALTATILVYELNSPWERLVAANKASRVEPVRAEKPLELGLPATNSLEQDVTWGDVRITDPGADLKVTKVDVVPLQIEAAANQELKEVSWFSTINGTEQTTHPLPPPPEPRYAVYQPTLYLDELRLSDWDVMTYYAKANTEQEKPFASEVYFLEVRPFREDILKIPGGEGGKAYRCLNEMSALIARQQHIIRQTHQHFQKPLEQEKLQAQDRTKLSDAEADLGDSAQHLYAKMAAELENKPIGQALDNLAKAQNSLDRASKLLREDATKEAQNRERSALAELVAVRKVFQKSLSEHPEAFDEPKEDETTPVADASRKLDQMAEFRNETKAAQEFVQKTLQQQRNLEQQSRSTPRNDLPRLAGQEQNLQQSLQDFQGQHPQVFKGTEAQSDAAQQAMTEAARALQKKSNDARNATSEAAQQLEKFSEALKNQSAEQQLANAYKLKQMLDRQIQSFGQCSKPGSNTSDAALQRTVAEARQTINQLKKVAGQEPTRDAFGPPLREALNGQNKVDLDAKLNQVQQAQDEAARQQRAAEAKEALSKVSRAFSDSQPKALQMAQKGDSLKPAEQESFNLGMAELDSLIKQLEGHRQLSTQDQAKQGQEALFNLQTGLRSRFGDNDRGNQILIQFQQALKEQALEAGNLKRLMDELQHFSVETADQLAQKEEKPDVTNIDPTRLPPAYRGRIQKYFQRLSEK